MPSIVRYGHGISAIDSNYIRPQLDAIHLIVENGRAAVIDTGTATSAPLVLEALAEMNLRPDQVDYVILTHVHLDHAGGAGELLRHCPNATLTVHPRGTRHMVDPSRLVAGTIAVYGEEATRRMYGEIVPVPRERIVETPDGMRLSLNGRELDFLETFGHARHHVAIHDRKSGHVFAGDTFGLSYRELDYDGHQFALPTTSPVQFDPEPYHRSIDRIVALDPEAVYVTHYSQVRRPREIAARLHELIDAQAELALTVRDAGPERYRRLEDGVRRILLEEAKRYGGPFGEARVLEVYGQDVVLNAQGLEAWLDSMARGALG